MFVLITKKKYYQENKEEIKKYTKEYYELYIGTSTAVCFKSPRQVRSSLSRS